MQIHSRLKFPCNRCLWLLVFVDNPDAGTMQFIKDVFHQLFSDSEFSLCTPQVACVKDCIDYFQSKDGDTGVVDLRGTISSQQA